MQLLRVPPKMVLGGAAALAAAQAAVAPVSPAPSALAVAATGDLASGAVARARKWRGHMRNYPFAVF